MKRQLLPLLALLLATLTAIGGCSSESSLPTPTGKGTIRALNAIPGSPSIGFSIEERLLGSMSYRGGVFGGDWDDLDYTFNFEIFFPGDTQATRVASQFLDVVADTDYTFVVTGDINAPGITIWEAPIREWSGTETSFESRFAHTSVTLGAVDVYFLAPDTDPVLGEQVGTLNFGEVLPYAEFEEGDYVIVFTDAGDPTVVHYESGGQPFAAQIQTTFSIIDGDEANTSPYVLTGSAGSGSIATVPDERFPSTLRFVHTAIDAGNIDIYNDEMLTNLVVQDLAFGQSTDPIERADQETYYITPANDPGVVLLERSSSQLDGTRANFAVLRTEDGIDSFIYVPDLQSRSLFGKVQFFGGAFNQPFTEVFAIEPDGEPTLGEILPRAGVPYAAATPPAEFVAAGYDLYVTPLGERETILTGPIRAEIAAGDVFEAILLDTDDPNVVDILFIPDLPPLP